MKKIVVGGVPEHFNLAWYLCLKDKAFKKSNINLLWKDYYEGTGAMCKALRNNEIDMAVILTEGIVKDIIEGNPSKIVQTFVETPLIWGIHVAPQSNFQKINDLKGTRAAISRYGSGSHLMAYVNAENNHWDLQNDLRFSVINNLEGAIQGINNGTADYFMWEKFTTKPLVDNGIFKRVGICPTPWPCFVIAVRNEFIENNLNTLSEVLKIINAYTKKFKKIKDIDALIAQRYEQNINDVKDWLLVTKWSQSLMPENVLEDVQNKLLQLNIISRKTNYEHLVYKI